MASVVLRLARPSSHRLVSATVLISALLVLGAATSPSEGLIFFRATEDSEQYAKDPGRYDPVSFASSPVSDTKRVVYVERQPALRVPLSEITSVTVARQRYYKNKTLEDKILEALRVKEEDTSEEGVEYYYDATFTLRPKAGRQIAKLLQRSQGKTFDLRLGTDRLSLVVITRLPAEYAGKLFTISLIERDIQRIRAIFAPLKDRITWK